MYKIGDKVEYRGEVVKITQIFYSDSERALHGIKWDFRSIRTFKLFRQT